MLIKLFFYKNRILLPKKLLEKVFFMRNFYKKYLPVIYCIDFQHFEFMKIIRIIFSAVFLILLNTSNVLAQGTPPAPGAPGNQVPGLPIDDHLPYLIIGGLILGISIIYRNKTKKASI